MRTIFYFLIFPGFLFTAILGLFAAWLDKKLTARFQWRLGPSWYQAFADFFKLLTKGVVIVQGRPLFIFLSAPAAGLIAVTIASTILWRAVFSPQEAFIGDLIVVLYLLTMPAVSLIIAGLSLSEPLPSLASRRHMKLIMAYELPFALSIFVPVVISRELINLGDLLEFQRVNGIFLHQPSAIIAFVIALVCLQGKLMFSPFDAPVDDAETAGGAYAGYSGTGLAFLKLTYMMNLFVMPFFLVVIFCGGIDTDSALHFAFGILKVAAILALMTVARNLAPRFRIDQAVRFFQGPVTAAAMVAVLLVFLGF